MFADVIESNPWLLPVISLAGGAANFALGGPVWVLVGIVFFLVVAIVALTRTVLRLRAELLAVTSSTRAAPRAGRPRTPSRGRGRPTPTTAPARRRPSG